MRRRPAIAYIDGDFMHVDDIHGHSVRIPLTRIPRMLGTAKQADDEVCGFALQWFHRDALQGAYDLLPQCDSCHDAVAFEDMGDGKTFCAACCSAAAGSRYDDRIEL